MKKWIKILLVTLGIIAVLVVTTILLLPPIAKNYLEKHSKELVGRQITIEKLRFNVLNGKLRIDRIAMLEPDDSTTFASLGNFYTRIHLLPLLRQRIHIDAVLIDKPYLNVYQDGTSFNFDDLLTRFLTPADTVEKAPSNPWTVDIDDIKIHNGELTYKDMQRNVTWGFNELDIDVPGLHLSGHERTDMGIVFNFSRGGSLRTSLEYDQATADYDLSLLLSNLSLAGTAAYFNQVIDIGSVEGLVTLDLHVKGNANHLLDLRTYGIAAASGLKLRDSRDNRGDTRVKYNLGEGDYGADGGRLTFCRKFLGDMSAGKMVLDADLIYYRAALAVMMDAELKYYRKDYGGALKSLNIIAKRAYGKDDYYTDASQEAVLEALVDEYFLEFPAEGVIWWALIRLDKIWDYNDYLAANRNNTNILLWPISKSARDKNSNLTQTEGWY